MCTVYILSVLLMVLLMSGVYVRVHVIMQNKPISRVGAHGRGGGHLSLEVCERTGHGPSFTFVK